MSDSRVQEETQAGFTVYGRAWCGYCSGALRILDQMGLDYSYIDIREQGISKQELAQKLERPVYTVPQILHGDQYIGGYTDLVPYLVSIREKTS